MNQQQASPVVSALISVLRSHVPELNQRYQEHDGSMIGRLQWRAGRSQMQHFTGLALDIILFRGVERERILAHHLCALFASRAAEMQWNTMIYEHSCFVRRGNRVVHQAYNGNSRHNTHIHIDWYTPGVVSGENFVRPPQANVADFGGRFTAQLVELNRKWLNGELAVLNLERDVLGVSTMTNVGV